MILREEAFLQTRGTGILELRGGELEVALFVAGKPFVYDANDCTGSVCRFTTLLPEPPELVRVRCIELNAQQGFEEAAPLKQQIASLLDLLPNGLYRLAVVETTGCWSVDWSNYVLQKPCPTIGYYPLGNNYERVKWLIPTQLEEALADERINFYLREIERGAHPALIVLGSKNHDAWFVLDGHHKLMASYCCGVRPRALLIEFEKLPRVSSAQASEILQDTSSEARSYLKTKKQREFLLDLIALSPPTR